MNTLKEFLIRHGFKVMMIGFALTLGSLLLFIGYVKNLDPQNSLRQLSFGMTVVGFSIWIVGRIFVQVQRKIQRQERMRRKAEADAEALDDDENPPTVEHK